MSKKFGRAQRATAIVPLAVLSVAWTASLAGVGADGLSASAARLGGGPPAPTLEVPAQALQSGGSVLSDDAVSAMGSVDPRGGLQQVAATSSTGAIPAAALSAYQRAESIINSADESCKLTWQVVAAIGRVESDHGRFGGSVLDADGVAQPAIIGVALDGTGKTARISDTDGGRYDDDTEFDRAVGPMQFIPDTWASIGVDADNDGQRNPQDIDDAALGTAVYLCSGDDDLSTLGGQRNAVFRYNNSEAYVDLVLSIAASYADGDYSAVPNDTVAAGTLTPVLTGPGAVSAGRGGAGQVSSGAAGSGRDDSATVGGSGGGSGGGSTGGGQSPSTPSSPTTPTTPGGGGTGGGGNGGAGNAGNAVRNTVKGAVKGVEDTVKGTVDAGGKAVGDVLTYAQARTKCLGELGLLGGLLPLTSAQNAQLDACIAKYT